MRRLDDRLMNNAMFYKDVTQCLRSHTTVALIMLLLVTCEAVVVINVMGTTSDAMSGEAIYTLLKTALLIYALLIGLNMTSKLARELNPSGFDLYRITGLSKERMTNGVLLSGYAQFLLGFFCVAPFAYFAALMGGIDYLDLLSLPLRLALLIVPGIMMSVVGVAAARWCGKHQGAAVVLVILITPFVLPTLGCSFGFLIAWIFNGSMWGVSAVLCAIFIDMFVCLMLYLICTSVMMPNRAGVPVNPIFVHQLLQKDAQKVLAQTQPPPLPNAAAPSE